MRIVRREDRSLQSVISYDPLPAIQRTWHPTAINVLSLKQVKRHRSNVHEVLYKGRLAVSKIACFPWQIPRIDNETWAYSLINKHQKQHPDEPSLAPNFLGHLAENGRVIGFLMEKLDGDFASKADLPKCEKAVRRLHGIGLIHGDVNRYNFLIDRSSGHVRMVDFEHVEDWDEKTAEVEIEALAYEFVEETGRGGPGVVVSEL